MATHDLSKLMKWMLQEPWSAFLEGVMAQHFEPAMETLDLEFDQIDEVLGGGFGPTLWGVAFEDALTRRTEDGVSPVEAYLTRRGWTESPGARRYISALKEATLSLYEVSEPKPGVSFLARDLLRGGEPVEVSERTASRTLKPWDRIAARLVRQGERHILSGALLAFTPEACDLLAQALHDVSGKRRRSKSAAPPPLAWRGDDESLRQAALWFTNAWLFDALPRAMGLTRPDLLNADGEEIVFHEVVFPLARDTTREAAGQRLDGLGDLRREGPARWTWTGPAPAGEPPAKEGLRWSITSMEGAVVLGSVELKGRKLALSVNSARRAERGQTILKEALGDLAKLPLVEIRTLDQVMAERDPNGPPASSDLPPELERQLVHDLLDRQYRFVLDEPVPALGGVSPRQAATTPKDRAKVVAWLKTLENRSGRAPDPDDPMATYDFTWMWRELGVLALRR